jgi:signal transduction histidine kinase
MPVLFVVIESLIFLPKAMRKTTFLPYFITLWSVRALLAPVIVFYTFRYWVEYNRIFKMFFIHLGGFFLFSILFWGLSYLALSEILYQNKLFGLDKNTDRLSVFGLIADNSISVNIIVYVSTVVFCHVSELFNRTLSANHRASELEKSLLVSRLEVLKGQLNTHFLFNTLHTISSLVVRHQNEEANKILVRLSELLRFSLRDNKDQLIPLAKEIEILQLYIDIQRTRFKERMRVNIAYDEDLSNALVPSLIFQPLVENAVKYAVEPFSETGIIDIDIRAGRSETLCICIRDNGKNDFKNARFNTGIGLSNTRERLKQLFGNNYKFVISPNTSGLGVQVSFIIPLQFANVERAENIDSR